MVCGNEHLGGATFKKIVWQDLRMGAIAVRWEEYREMRNAAWKTEYDRRINEVNAQEAAEHAAAVKVERWLSEVDTVYHELDALIKKYAEGEDVRAEDWDAIAAGRERKVLAIVARNHPKETWPRGVPYPNVIAKALWCRQEACRRQESVLKHHIMTKDIALRGALNMWTEYCVYGQPISQRPRKLEQTLHCELVETGLGDEVEGVGEREAPWQWLTVYEMENAQKATESTYDESNHAVLTGPLAQARFDVRTYGEVKRWQKEDWDGNHRDIASVAVMEWLIKPGEEKAVLDFYISEAAPTIASSPDVLRFRLFKIANATVQKAESYDTLERNKLHTYLTVIELESEEWPWDVVIALGAKPKWRQYFEDQKSVKWQSSHYLVKRSYPDSGEEDGVE